MQILFLTHRLPYPPDKGERIRAFHELRYLAARHDVDLFCFADSAECAEQQQYLRGICRSVYVEVLQRPVRLLQGVGNFLVGRPLSFGYFHSRKFDNKVQEALRRRNYDVIFIYCSSMASSVPQPAPAPIVVDFVDADSQKFKQYASRSGWLSRWLYAREAHAVAVAEQSLGQRAALAFATTQHDARELGGSGLTSFPVAVVANGVQVPDVPHEQEKSEFPELKPYALFLGTMNYPPNSDAAAHFARDIFPLVRKTHPQLKFVIIGRDPDRQVRQLASIPGVLVTGAVPDRFSVLSQCRSNGSSLQNFARVSQQDRGIIGGGDSRCYHRQGDGGNWSFGTRGSFRCGHARGLCGPGESRAKRPALAA